MDPSSSFEPWVFPDELFGQELVVVVGESNTGHRLKMKCLDAFAWVKGPCTI